MSPVVTQRLVDLARAVGSARHGEKTVLCRAAATELGMSVSTIYRKLEAITMKSPRKKRRDLGSSALTLEEAKIISAALVAAARANQKRLYSVADAVLALRRDGKIAAESINPETGEILPLSPSAIILALRAWRLHPDQILTPSPSVQMKSLHPNHVWQIDASLCVLYYLKPGAGANGLQVMDRAEFYKNKPKNMDRISADRVWSYEITDHFSGWIYVTYVMGAETGANFCRVFIDAMAERGGSDMLHGVPEILMMDPGAANTSAMVKNLCKALGVRVIAHAPGAARVTGQVENARNIIERKFESTLRFQPVADLDALNEAARVWRGFFNRTAIHSRHDKTRTAAWMAIHPDKLVKAPSVAICRELATAAPERRKVSQNLRVSFQGEEYDVSKIEGVFVGDKVLVTKNPWREDAAQLVRTGEDGREVFSVVPRVEKDDAGFPVNAPVIGQSFHALPETVTERNAREIERIIWGETDVKAAKKAKKTPFNGTFNPRNHMTGADLPDFLPRRGRAHGLTPPTVEMTPMNHVEAAKALRARMGEDWTPDSMAWLKKEFPQGVPEGELENIVNRLTRPSLLKIVGGTAP
ncbi:integrase [Alphaproteobacteria bacterium]|nr:integrase [Alphaproteobacteria bacterium]